MRKFQLSGILLGSSIVQNSKSEVSQSDQEPIRRTSLPIYPEETKPEVDETPHNGNPLLQNAVKSFRMQGCKLVRTVKPIADKCSHIYETGVAHSYSSYVNAVDYLRDERNLLPQIGAIGGGVLVGYVIGRKSFFRRLLYSSIIGSTVAAICYPKIASEYLEVSSQLSKKYLNIGYHFLNGVSKDYIGFELPVLPLKTITQTEQNVKPDDKSQ